jgi:hypothetical protein
MININIIRLECYIVNPGDFRPWRSDEAEVDKTISSSRVPVPIYSQEGYGME